MDPGQWLGWGLGAYAEVSTNGPVRLRTGRDMPRPGMAPREVLRLPSDGELTAGQVRQAYYRTSLEWHPDRWSAYGPGLQEEAAQIFQIVGNAYEVLRGVVESGDVGE